MSMAQSMRVSLRTVGRVATRSVRSVAGTAAFQAITADADPGDRVSMYVTVYNGTAESYLSIHPAAPVKGDPQFANLKWRQGQEWTPNKVNGRLSDNGAIRNFNFAGEVDLGAVIVTAVGSDGLDSDQPNAGRCWIGQTSMGPSETLAGVPNEFSDDGSRWENPSRCGTCST